MTRIIIDLRSPLEYKMSHAKGAINISPTSLMGGIPEQLADTPKDAEIILYCISGARSNTATHILRQYGFTNLVNGINKEQVTARYLD